MRDELVEASRDLDVAFLGGVLVAQRCGAGGVAHPVHEFRRGGTGRRGDRVRGVPEIVEVELVRKIGDRGSGELPVAVDGALAQDLGSFPGEEVAGLAGRGEVGQVVLELGDEERGERDGANARLSLGSADDECAVVELHLLLVDTKGPVEEIDVSAFETEELTSA